MFGEYNIEVEISSQWRRNIEIIELLDQYSFGTGQNVKLQIW